MKAHEVLGGCPAHEPSHFCLHICGRKLSHRLDTLLRRGGYKGLTASDASGGRLYGLLRLPITFPPTIFLLLHHLPFGCRLPSQLSRQLERIMRKIEHPEPEEGQYPHNWFYKSSENIKKSSLLVQCRVILVLRLAFT